MFKTLSLILFLTSVVFSQKTTHQSTIPTTPFYPFGEKVGDYLSPERDDSYAGPIEISIFFPFFQTSWKEVYVNTNGLLTFNNSVTSFIPARFPLKDTIGVAPYWGDVDIRNGGEIYFRELTDYDVLNLIASDIRQAFTSFVNFRPIWAYMVTYDEVAAYGSKDPNINNTFQVVITTNGKNSFAIFNYGKLMWSIGTASAVHTQAGFNAGDNQTYYVLPGSFTSDVLQLTYLSNINVPGKWIFRIDTANITEGACHAAGFLTTAPNTVYFIGQDHIIVKGPCFLKNNSYQLKYDNNENFVEDCKVIDTSKAICKVPYLNKVGNIPIVMSINGNYSFEGTIISKNVPLKPDIDGIENYYTADKLGKVTITWTQDKKTVQFSDNQKSLVSFVFIDESCNCPKTIVLNNDANENGTTIDLKQAVEPLLSTNVKSFYIAVGSSFTFQDLSNTFVSYSHLRQVIVSLDYASDTTSQCLKWFENEPDAENVKNSLNPCPRDVMVTNGKFPDGFSDFKLDTTCNPDNSKSCDAFRPGAKACYVSISTNNGIKQQCCYSSNYELLVGYPGGGSLLVGNNDETFAKNLNPYLLCCKYSNNCDLYYKKRPSNDGSKYKPQTPAGPSGTNIITLDGVKYTLNGYGEYTLLEIKEKNFTIQARTTPYTDQNGTSLGITVFTALVVKGDSIDSVQVEINRAKKIDIFVNGRLFDIDEKLTNLELRGSLMAISKDRYFLQFANGINAEIKLAENNEAMSALIYVPESYKNKTTGLLGNMDDDISNEFSLANGTVLNLNATDDKNISTIFCSGWKNDEITTIFNYADGYNHSDFKNDSFIPKFMSDGFEFDDSALEELAREQCGDDENCLFVVSVTGKLNIAKMEYEFTANIEKILEHNEASALKQCEEEKKI